ncbi:MAG: sporulation protein YqfD [Clostridia bacterium]|jgi:similar to stage IV sporulation protein|nr:sporulation protein YqfD [Clostridia bacterium]
MFVWNYLKGYVIIKAVGFYAQRFMNLAAYRGIKIWDVKNEDMVFTVTFSYGDLKRIEKCALDAGCRIKVIKEAGLPVVLKRYRKRTSFIAGAAFFVLFICFLSMFIWSIRVEGNLKIPTEKILSYVNESGLRPGTLKSTPDLGSISNRLILDFDDVAWATIRLDGTKAVVSISEGTKSNIKPQDEQACDIVAKRDGVIESITVISGTAQVRSGDVVQKGQVLVKGVVMIANDDGTFTEKPVVPKAFIRATTVYHMKETVPIKINEKKRTGEKRTWIAFKVADNDFAFGMPLNFKSFETQKNKIFEFDIGDWVFPFEVYKQDFYEVNNVQKKATKEELLKKAENMLDAWTEENLDFDSYVVKCEKNSNINDRGLIMDVVLTVSERIDTNQR